MAFLRLTRETLSEIKLAEGAAKHKFITTPSRIYFGNDGEYHRTLLSDLKGLYETEPDTLSYAKEMFGRANLMACGAHLETQELAVVDAGLMVVEGLEVPETVSFIDRSTDYGMGDRTHTQMLAGLALHGSWKLHLPQEPTEV
jgi:hypothetical protein